MHPTLFTPSHPYLGSNNTPLKHQTPRLSPHHSEFTESPLGSSSSGENDSFSKPRVQLSRPSTSSEGALNTRMQQLLTPAYPPVVQPIWPPMVIQLEEAPQVPQPRDNIDTHHSRMERIDVWRRDAGEHNSPSSVPPVLRCSPTLSAAVASRPYQEHAQTQTQVNRVSAPCIYC
jgi:hypothetical protein